MPPTKPSNAAESNQVEGLLLVDKPAGITSHDAVQIVRRAYDQSSVGHLGTLDPFATGLLVMLLGRSTRLATFIDADPKVYEAVIAFGSETNTDDLTGDVVRTANAPAEDVVRKFIPRLTGDISQVPPAFSAKQIDGQRAYVSARKGEDIELKPVEVKVYDWQVVAFDGAELRATISCSAGTYIRSLARDLGRLTNSAAHLKALRRTRSGSFDVANAATIEQIKNSPPAPITLAVVPQ
jgi:tRNA pseudouridine55 synthase